MMEKINMLTLDLLKKVVDEFSNVEEIEHFCDVPVIVSTAHEAGAARLIVLVKTKADYFVALADNEDDLDELKTCGEIVRGFVIREVKDNEQK